MVKGKGSRKHNKCTPLPNPDMQGSIDRNSKKLNCTQMERLHSVLHDVVDIHGTGNFPTISVPLLHLILCVKKHLTSAGIGLDSVKLNGGAASYVAASREFVYTDLDLIFKTKFSIEENFDVVRISLFNALVELMPSTTNKTRISADTLKDIYVRKMVKVVDKEFGDKWSLFSLHNDYGRNIELKFVDTMRRQYEFSVDSFQVLLDPILDHEDASTTTLESVYGDVDQALGHLHDRLICTKNPELIRGGGLLKYCHLLTRGFKTSSHDDYHTIEKYMCSRFFIDFPDLCSQESKLQSYLENHFGNYDSWSCNDESDSEASTSQTPSALAVSQAKYDFLMLLHRVISESTVCLMQHDRRQTLSLVDRMAFNLSMSPLSFSPSPSLCPSSAPSPTPGGHTPRPILLYLPANSPHWIPVV